MALTSKTSYRLAGHLFEDEDFDENANLKIDSQLGTRTLSLLIPATACQLSGSSVAKTRQDNLAGVTLPNANSGSLFVSFPFPNEYSSGNVTLRILWTSGATSGDLRLVADVKSIAATGTTASEETVTATDTAKGNANRTNEVTLTLSNTNFTKNDVVGLKITREPGNGSDTLSADAIIHAIAVEYTGRG